MNMSGIIAGILFTSLSVYLVLPVDWSTAWLEEFVFVLKGLAPLVLLFFGLFYFVMGASDIHEARTRKKQFKKIEQKDENLS